MLPRWAVLGALFAALAGGGRREVAAARLRAGAGASTVGDGLSPIQFDTEAGVTAVNTADSEAEALWLKEEEHAGGST